ncbi:hypothetical protein D3C72_2143110 [compost metagenome]
MAMRAASTEPRPAVSAYRPDMSDSTPTRTLSSLSFWAAACPASAMPITPHAHNARPASFGMPMDLSPCSERIAAS